MSYSKADNAELEQKLQQQQEQQPQQYISNNNNNNFRPQLLRH